MERVKKLLILLGSILLVIALLIVFLYVQITKPYSEIINMNWSIKLPTSYKEIYSVDSGASFHGDGERYHVFEYKNEEDINLSLNWKNNKNVAIESSTEKVLNTLNISKEEMPNFESEYKHYTKEKEDDSSKIYLIFFTDTKKLYVIEDIR